MSSCMQTRVYLKLPAFNRLSVLVGERIGVHAEDVLTPLKRSVIFTYISLRGVNLNYRSRIVAKGLLRTIFFDKLF